MDITIHGADALSAPLRRAWHRAMDESPDYANPFLAPEFTAGIGRHRAGAKVAVLREHAEPVGFFPYERNSLGIGRAMGLGLSDLQALVHRPGVTWDAQELLRACGLSVFEFDHLVEDQRPFGHYVTGTFASPAIDLKPESEELGYAQWLRGAYPGLAKTTLKKERRPERDTGELRFVFDERDPRVLRTLMRWKSAQYRRTGRMDRFARAWIVALVEHLFQVREEHFTGVLSVLYAGEQPVAAHFGPRSRTVFACWFTAYDPAYRYYSPGLLMHLRMAAAGRDGVALMDLGRGEKQYKDWLKTRELRVGEGFAARPHPVALAHRMWRRPVRGLRNTVLAHPALRQPADRLLKAAGTLRSASGTPFPR
ncbi:GNAT family N-acetyltransferase [Streptomyces monticola]|uniref:GNAT family N-acetyltransferase n=1 Tax=Streptomyces monticola TaxID=2666263 RepID=A0ABW2JEI2_9ACTN